MSQIPIIIPIEEVTNHQRIVLQSAGFNAIKTTAFQAVISPVVGPNNSLNNLSPVYANAPYDDDYTNGKLMGAFNIPVFDLITFKAPINFTDPNGKNWVLQDLEILTCLIEVNQDRHIIKTAIQGRNGTIKEYISDDDYYIKINGLLASNYQDIFPQKEMASMMQYCTIPTNFQVTSPLLNRYFNVTNIVIQDYHFYQIEGDRSNIGFEITAISEPSYEIKLKYN